MNKREIKEAVIEANQDIERSKFWKEVRNRFLQLLIAIPVSVCVFIWGYHVFLG
jgi:hypothetical protein